MQKTQGTSQESVNYSATTKSPTSPHVGSASINFGKEYVPALSTRIRRYDQIEDAQPTKKKDNIYMYIHARTHMVYMLRPTTSPGFHLDKKTTEFDSNSNTSRAHGCSWIGGQLGFIREHPSSTPRTRHPKSTLYIRRHLTTSRHPTAPQQQTNTRKAYVYIYVQARPEAIQIDYWTHTRLQDGYVN